MTEDDDPLEQATLALDLVKFHTGECKSSASDAAVSEPYHVAVSQTAFPRKQTMENILFVIRQQPKLAKDASFALIDIGQAVQSSVKPEELRVLLRGTLIQEVYVRNACLQTLQVCIRCMHGETVLTIE